jgi:hypothetical protein
MVFCSECDIPVLCEMNMLGTSDPEDHTLTAPTFLPSIIEMPLTTSFQWNSPEDSNLHQHCYNTWRVLQYLKVQLLDSFNISDGSVWKENVTWQ